MYRTLRAPAMILTATAFLATGCPGKQTPATDPEPATAGPAAEAPATETPAATPAPTDQEPNNDFESALALPLGETMQGTVSMSGDMNDYYTFAGEPESKLGFTFTSGTKPDSSYLTYTIYDGNREQILNPGSVDVDAGTSKTVELEVGESGATYWLRVETNGPENDYQIKVEVAP